MGVPGSIHGRLADHRRPFGRTRRSRPLQQIFPSAGQLAPIAGTLVTRAYSRSEELAADRHAVGILERAGYSKASLESALVWLRQVSGAGGGGFFSTHPGIDERRTALRRL